jgi:hypothetical protein
MHEWIRTQPSSYPAEVLIAAATPQDKAHVAMRYNYSFRRGLFVTKETRRRPSRLTEASRAAG